MSDGQTRSGDASRSAAGALPCVWMTAGMVAYKLCDREFDCEHCPLDLALRGPQRRVPAGAPVQEGTAGPFEFQADRLYHPAHLWALPVGESRLRLGLDAFAVRLLDRISAVVLPQAGHRIERGLTACWVMDEAQTIPLRSPVSGIVREGNLTAQEHPALVGQSPYDRGWLLEVSIEGPAKELKGLLCAEEMRDLGVEHLRRLHQDASRLCAEDARVGTTLADGGIRLAELRRILGAARYHQLVLGYLR